MTANVRHPASAQTATEVNRVVKITARDLIDPTPDTLTLLKRAVNTMDGIEVSDNPQWVTRTGTLPAQYRNLFARGQYDRIRYRHYIYGLDKPGQQLALTAVNAALV